MGLRVAKPMVHGRYNSNAYLYIMKDPDGVEHEFICSIAEMQAKKVLGWTMVFKSSRK